MTFENNARGSAEASISKIQPNHVSDEAIATMMNSRGDAINRNSAVAPKGTNEAQIGKDYIEFSSNSAAGDAKFQNNRAAGGGSDRTTNTKATTPDGHECKSSSGSAGGESGPAEKFASNDPRSEQRQHDRSGPKDRGIAVPAHYQINNQKRG